MEISSHIGSLITPPASSNQGTQRSANESATDKSTSSKEKDPLSDPNSEESKQVRKLQARDREVRAHEQAHLSAAGQYARGGANFTYQKGPDGKNYAVGGEVSIDSSPVSGNPQATLAKAQAIQRAALAPASPSSQDHSVAAAAGKMALEARSEIQEERTEEIDEASAETETSESPEAAEASEALEAFETSGASDTQALEQRLKQSGALESGPAQAAERILDAFV